MNVNSEEIMVSIACLAFNHEKYIRKCLEGFVTQQCNFKFEVLIHDDASTDNTAEIIREYEQKYPDIIKPIYQTENKHSQGISCTKVYNIPRAAGKYFAMCEGDDYWDDPHKLQKQFDIMEQNPDCSICLHKVAQISEDGEPMTFTYPNFKFETGKYPSEKMVDLICYQVYPFQLSSYFMKTEVIKNLVSESPDFSKVKGFGDIVYILYCVSKGDFYYIDEVMSKYRYLSKGSWSARNVGNIERRIFHNNEVAKMINRFDEYTGKKYHKQCDHMKREREFKNAVIQSNYKLMADPNYKEFLNKNYNAKNKFFIRLSAKFPKIAKKIFKR